MVLAAQAARADEVVWAMADAGNGHLWQINVTQDTKQDMGRLRDPVLGDVGTGWSTIAETPDKNLYFMRRYQDDVHMFRLDSTNIVSSGGVITNLSSLGSTGLGGNLDGLTAGPDGNLYFTAYQNNNAHFPANGLLRFHPGTATTDLVGTFGGGNAFYTDLAFDPISGDLLGTGNGGSTIYRINGGAALGGNHQTFNYNTAFPALGLDGLAFNRISGQMYESSDTGGVFEVNRTTGAFIRYVGGTQGTNIGTDLAVQADTIPNPTVPEPGTMSLIATGLAVVLGARRRNRR
jgi:hypothetical protein